jgi:hypothetical protein
LKDLRYPGGPAFAAGRDGCRGATNSIPSDRLLLTRESDRPPTPSSTEGYVSVATLLAESNHESIPSRRLALAGDDPGSPPRAVLSLDLGQKTGWAVRNADGAIASGTTEFKPGRFEGGEMIYLRFRAWLKEVDETAGGVGPVYFEEVRSHRGVAAAHVYGGFLAYLTPQAEMNNMLHAGVPVGPIKRHVTGRGIADKDAVIAAVRRLGFDAADHNEADALALFHRALRNGGPR